MGKAGGAGPTTYDDDDEEEEEEEEEKLPPYDQDKDYVRLAFRMCGIEAEYDTYLSDPRADERSDRIDNAVGFLTIKSTLESKYVGQKVKFLLEKDLDDEEVEESFRKAGQGDAYDSWLLDPEAEEREKRQEDAVKFLTTESVKKARVGAKVTFMKGKQMDDDEIRRAFAAVGEEEAYQHWLDHPEEEAIQQAVEFLSNENVAKSRTDETIREAFEKVGQTEEFDDFVRLEASSPFDEEKMESAVKFLSNERIKSQDTSKKVRFLHAKEMTDAEVREAFKRAGSESEYLEYVRSTSPVHSVEHCRTKEDLDAFLAKAPNLSLCVVGFHESHAKSAKDKVRGQKDGDVHSGAGDVAAVAEADGQESAADEADGVEDDAFGTALGALANAVAGERKEKGETTDHEVLFRRVDTRGSPELALAAPTRLPCLCFYRNATLVHSYEVPAGMDPSLSLSGTEVHKLVVRLSTLKMSFEQLEESTLDAFAALNGGNLDTLLALFADEGAVYDEFNGQKCEGKQAIRKALAPQFDASRWGHVKFRLEGLMVDANNSQTTLMWVCSNDKGAQYREWRGIDVFTFKYGRIVSKETYCKADRPLFLSKSSLISSGCIRTISSSWIRIWNS